MMEPSIGKPGLEDGNQPLTPPWHPATPSLSAQFSASGVMLPTKLRICGLPEQN